MEIIFDFDGTIADTFEVGIDIVNRLATQYNYPGVGQEEIQAVRDLGIRGALRLMRKNGVSWLKLLRIGRRIQRELNKEIDKVKVFKGVKEVIKELKKDGYVLGILSTNTKRNINDFLRVNKLDNMFDYVETCGFIWGKTRRLKRIMKRRSLAPGDVIYIGDETKDIATCRKLKVKIAVVTWGFNAEKALKGYRPDWLVTKPEEILKVVKGEGI